MHAMREMRITMTALTWAMPILLAVLGIVASRTVLSVKGRQPNPAPWQKPILQAGASGAWRKAKRWTGSSTCCPVIWEEASKSSYEDVSAGRTGHAESVEVRYDPRKLTYPQLLEAFWRNVDPLRRRRNFAIMGISIEPPFFIRGKRKNVWQRNQNARSNSQSGFRRRLRRK